MFRICHQNICLINKSIITCASIKDVVSKSIKFSPKYTIRHFASGEKENNKLERIYYGPLTPQIRAVKLFSVGSSALGLAAQPIILREANTIGSTSLLIAICSVVGFFTFVTPLLLHFITKKYVTEIHYDPVTLTYRATTLSFFLTSVKWEAEVSIFQKGRYCDRLPGKISACLAIYNAVLVAILLFPSVRVYLAKSTEYTERQLDFKVEDVVVPDIPGMFTTMHAKGKPLFIEARHFSDPLHYAKMMGYDKPLDFKLGENPEEDNNK